MVNKRFDSKPKPLATFRHRPASNARYKIESNCDIHTSKIDRPAATFVPDHSSANSYFWHDAKTMKTVHYFIRFLSIAVLIGVLLTAAC